VKKYCGKDSFGRNVQLKDFSLEFGRDQTFLFLTKRPEGSSV
jgi:hypothetical protein